MEQIEKLSRFIKEHASDDLNRLLLSASRYPGIDIPFVVDQLKSRRQIKDKLPSWYQNDRLVFSGEDSGGAMFLGTDCLVQTEVGRSTGTCM